MYTEIELECLNCMESFHHEFDLKEKYKTPNGLSLESDEEEIECEECGFKAKIKLKGDLDVHLR
jgi:DNA-directed RNA polymerase subunit RPC12/RpoP